MIEKTIEDVKSFWNANPLISGEIDGEPGTREWFERFDVIKREVFFGDLSAWIAPKLVRGKKILDVGCGPGFWNRQCAKLDCQYFGVDISDRSVALAKKSQEFFNCPGTIREGNAEALPFEDAAFDRIISEGVIHHTPNTERCVEEIFRVLKSGGTATVSVYYKNILLRNPGIFRVSARLASLFGVGLKGRGRDVMMNADGVDEFIRIYDGADNPIGKGYSRQEFLAMFKDFSEVKTELYYFPKRAFPIHIPKCLCGFLAKRFGFMILARVVK